MAVQIKTFLSLSYAICWIGWGFNERNAGDHHIFYKDGIEEIINLQPKGTLAKAYQVKQVRNIILKYRLGGGGDA